MPSYLNMVHLRFSNLVSRVKTSNALANAEPSRTPMTRTKNITEKASGDTLRETLDPPEQRAPTINSLPIELLQHIFSFLDCLALLKSRCVCTLWADCTPSTSSDLQRALFLPQVNTTPSPISATLYFEIFTTAPTNYRRYSRARVPLIPQVTKVALAFQTRCVDVHPLIEKIDRFLVARVPDLDVDLDVIEPHAQPHDSHFTHLRNKFGDLLQPDAIPLFKDMFATSPPVTFLYIKFRYVDREFGEIEPKLDRCNCSLSDSEGVLFGDLWYVLEAQVMGLLRLETMRRIDARPKENVYLAQLREKVRDTTCPV
jgi:hypothetical protein